MDSLGDWKNSKLISQEHDCISILLRPLDTDMSVFKQRKNRFLHSVPCDTLCEKCYNKQILLTYLLTYREDHINMPLLQDKKHFHIKRKLFSFPLNMEMLGECGSVSK